MSSLPALVTGDMTQVLLSGCCWVGMVLVVVSSIPISILRATMVMWNSSIVRVAPMVMGVSSRVWGKTGLLLGSGVVLPLSILLFAALYLLLGFNHEGSVYQLLIVGECCHH